MKTKPIKGERAPELKPLADTKVEEVLSEKPPSLHPDDSVKQAGDRMREMHAGQWPVVKEEKLVGRVDGPNLDQNVARYGHDPKSTLVAQNMSREVAYCYEDQSCEEALAMMNERQLEFLPVVDRSERITGIVSREELLAKCSKG